MCRVQVTHTSVAQPAPLLYLNSASVPAPALNYRYYFKKIVKRKAVLFFSVDNWFDRNPIPIIRCLISTPILFRTPIDDKVSFFVCCGGKQGNRDPKNLNAVVGGGAAAAAAVLAGPLAGGAAALPTTGIANNHQPVLAAGHSAGEIIYPTFPSHSTWLFICFRRLALRILPFKKTGSLRLCPIWDLNYKKTKNLWKCQ